MGIGLDANHAFQFAERDLRRTAVQAHDEIARRKLVAQLAECVAHHALDGIACDSAGGVALGNDQAKLALAIHLRWNTCRVGNSVSRLGKAGRGCGYSCRIRK